MQHPVLTGAQHIKLGCATYEAESLNLWHSCPAVYSPHLSSLYQEKF